MFISRRLMVTVKDTCMFPWKKYVEIIGWKYPHVSMKQQFRMVYYFQIQKVLTYWNRNHQILQKPAFPMCKALFLLSCSDYTRIWTLECSSCLYSFASRCLCLGLLNCVHLFHLCVQVQLNSLILSPFLSLMLATKSMKHFSNKIETQNVTICASEKKNTEYL